MDDFFYYKVINLRKCANMQIHIILKLHEIMSGKPIKSASVVLTENLLTKGLKISNL